MKHRHMLVALAAILVLFAACGGGKNDQSKEEASQAATADTSSAKTETAEATSDSATAAQPEEFAGAHILIMYKGSMRAPETVTRTKEEALKLAQELTDRARKGEDFAELAKKYSDGPSGPRGGNLGTWTKGRMVPEFDTAIEKLKIGGVSDPVETAFGYHVILRKPVEKIYCRHILIMHEGSTRKPPNITRTRDEAMARAQEVLDKIKAGENFEDLAREYSDGPTATRGGDLGGFGKGMMVPAFEEAAFALPVGGVSGIVETPFGFHIIQRYK